MTEQSGRGTPAWYDEPGTAFLPKQQTPAAQPSDAARLAQIEKEQARRYADYGYTQTYSEIAWLLGVVKRQQTLLDRCVGLFTPLAYYLDTTQAGKSAVTEIRSLVERVKRA